MSFWLKSALFIAIGYTALTLLIDSDDYEEDTIAGVKLSHKFKPHQRYNMMNRSAAEKDDNEKGFSLSASGIFN